MKQLLILAALLCQSVAMWAGMSLRVTPKTGDPVSFLFEQQPEVSFLAGSLRIQTAGNGQPVVFELNEIDHISFGDSSSASLPEEAGIRFFADSEGVHFLNIPLGLHAGIYDASGRALLSRTTTDPELHISRSSYPSGVYIVKIGSFNTKIKF